MNPCCDSNQYFQLTRLAVGTILLLSHIGCERWRNSPHIASQLGTSSDELTIDLGRIAFNGRLLVLDRPFEDWVDVLGEPSREEDMFRLWDDLGLAVQLDYEQRIVQMIVVAVRASENRRFWEPNNGVVVEDHSTPASLTAGWTGPKLFRSVLPTYYGYRAYAPHWAFLKVDFLDNGDLQSVSASRLDSEDPAYRDASSDN